MYYDKKGRKLSRAEFAPLFRDEDYRRVAFTKFPSGDFVSTVWLGIDHGFGGEVLIFESMSHEDGDFKECDRYSTEEEAREGHTRMVAIVRARQMKLPTKGRKLDLN